jgi:hypothetical protein
MDEIGRLLTKYDESYIKMGLHSADDVTEFAATFYKDVAELYDCITRVKNTERNPSGYSIADAPILGLLVRVWKLLKEVIRYYEEDNAEIIGVLERPILESAIIARFLMQGDDDLIDDYRRCSYKDRLRMLRELKAGSAFFETNAGQRLLRSVRQKLAHESLTEDDFAFQKKNRWRLQGKTFFDIFREVEREALYPSTYGMMSESIHGSWNDLMDYDLQRNEDGTFSAFPFFQPADIRYVTPLLHFVTPAYRLWLRRIGADEAGLEQVLDWSDRVNRALFRRFDEAYTS